MQFDWIGERVSVVDLKRTLKNIILEQDDVAWGPNNTFKFPLYGGTGEIFRRLARRIRDRIEYGQSVVSIDAEKKIVTTDTGLEVEYETLLNTAPVDILASQWLTEKNDAMVDAANDLTHNSVHVSGVGLDAGEAAKRNSRCWMYFPESNSPFYRVTNSTTTHPTTWPAPANSWHSCARHPSRSTNRKG